MFLSRFSVKNYKCLGEIEIPLTPIHVLIGQNDAGKTSLLEAMAAFCRSFREPVEQLFPEPWGGRELVNHLSPEPRIDFAGGWLGTARGEAPSSPEPRFHGYSFSVVFSPSERGYKLENTTMTYRTLAEVAGPAHKYRLDAALMAVPAAIDSDRRFRLDPDGFGLATLLDDILGHSPELFLKIRSEFCDFFPQFRSVRVQSERAIARSYSRGPSGHSDHYGAQGPSGQYASQGTQGPYERHGHQDSSGPNGASGLYGSTLGSGKGIILETQGGHSIRAQQASDGAILFLGFLALANLPEPPSLLLIEEPENGIYPKRLGEVIQLLKQLVNRTDGKPFPQIILSTHSPYVLSFFEPEEVTFLSRDPSKEGSPVRARPLRDAPNIRERLAGGEFYLGELWYNLSEEELFGES